MNNNLDITNISTKSLTEEQKDDLAVYLSYMILMSQLTLDNINLYPKDITSRVNCLLNYEMDNNMILSLLYKLNKLSSTLAIEKSNDFSLEKFLDKEDSCKSFLYDCPFNMDYEKSALGLIFPNKSFYCDIPGNCNHADIVTAYLRKEEPEYEDLSEYHWFHPENSDWHNKVMQDKNAIIIHFIPNEYGEVIYIPEQITEYQYMELMRINSLLQRKGINAETNYNDMDLTSVLNSQEFIESHVVYNISNVKK